MARMPGAVWRPLAADYDRQPRLAVVNVLCLHTMVGGLDGTDGYFRAGNGAGYDGTESHFGVGGDGRTVQWQDTAYQADANLEGNVDVVSFETADHGPEFPRWTGSDVPAWTPAQVEGLGQGLAWGALEHAVPLELVPDSKPGRRGVAYHRQGCDPWRVAGGRRWSSSRGKVCPGDRRIAQVPAVIDRARVIVAEVIAMAGQLPPRPTPPPAPGPPPAPRPPRLPWHLSRGHWLGNLVGPANQHGGHPRYDTAATRELVRNVQRWFVYRGVVPGVPSSSWATSSWADGRWEDATDRAAAEWHRRYYPGQPQPAQVWADDYARLTA